MSIVKHICWYIYSSSPMGYKLVLTVNNKSLNGTKNHENEDPGIRENVL